MLLDWSSKVSKKYVSRELSQEIHTKAEPFIKWLKEAEEEESDSDDDDDVEVNRFFFPERGFYCRSTRISPVAVTSRVVLRN